MERPKGAWKPVQRQVTGEVMYIQDRWQNGQQVGDYAELPTNARRMYEEDAALLVNLGGKPSVFYTYEEHDRARSELSHSCEALAEELLKFRGSYSDGSQEMFSTPLLPREVYAKLMQLRAAEILAADTEQLAKPSDFDEGDEFDVRKADGVLTDASVRVWKYGARQKRVITSESGVEPQYPRDFLTYPSNEAAHSYLVEVCFEYYHPNVDVISETIGLYINEEGALTVVRDMYVPGLSAAASEGQCRKVLADASQLDIATFADFIAEIVGDEPAPMWSHNNYDDIRDYINRVANGLTRAYLTEWLDNTSSSHVRWNLSRRFIDGLALRDALMDSYNPHVHDEIVEIVNSERRLHNARVEAELASTGSDPASPWRDRIER